MLLAAIASGAAGGFFLGVAAQVLRLPRTSAVGAGLAVGAAAIADLVVQRSGRWRAPAVRTQVPNEWALVLPLPTAAALYGARLGIGPLTLAAPWLWWSAALLAATGGASIGALVGGVFGGARIALVLVVSKIAERDMAPRMARLRANERAAVMACSLAAIAFGVALAAVAP